MIGQMLGHYRVVEKIGAGGMGEVYRAHDERLERDVALKVLPTGTLADASARKRFRKEALTLSRLNHPHIATVHDFDTQDGVDFLAMELVEGKTLAERLTQGSLPEKEIARLGAQIADALQEAHEQGIVHRDLKPGNIKLTAKGQVKILDFGIAKLLRPVSEGATTETFTEPRGIAGTLPYMAPEQLLGEPVDARSDLYSFGVVLYEMATGQRPFEEKLSTALSDAILHRAPPPLRTVNRRISAGLENIILKCLEKDPEHRYQSAKELSVDLRRLAAPAAIQITPSPQALLPQAEPRGAWGKFLRRPLALSIAVAALLALLVGLNVGGLRQRLLGGPAPGEINAIAVLVQLTTLPGLEDSPTWSPDGRSIAYVSDAAGNLDIYVQEIGGGRAIRLTESDADDAQPAWSPDGSRISFVSARAYPGKRLSTLLNMGAWQTFFAGRNGDIWLMPALGGHSRRLAENAYYPAWSPDGQQIVYQAMRQGEWGLWIQEVDSPVNLTPWIRPTWMSK
jgi:hypothetical protein